MINKYFTTLRLTELSLSEFFFLTKLFVNNKSKVTFISIILFHKLLRRIFFNYFILAIFNYVCMEKDRNKQEIIFNKICATN